MSKISGFNASGESIDTIDGDKLTFSNKPIDESKIGKNGCEKISFGNFNIGIRTSEQSDTSNIMRKFHEDTKKNSMCIIDIPEEDEGDKINNSKIHFSFNNKKKKIRKERIYYKTDNNVKLNFILDQYRGKENKKFEWPEETEICCWWCCHSFEGPPKTLPYKYDELRNRFKVLGIFCSWSCAKSYAINDKSVSSRDFTMLNLTEFTRQIYGYVINIPLAPPRQSLKMFGGKMSIKDFRNLDKNIYININKVDSILDPNVYFSVKTT